jgi:hypothetical protein
MGGAKYCHICGSNLMSNISNDANMLYPARKNGKWGYINKKGNWVVSPQFENAQNFHDGLAGVSFEGKYGYIDTTGTLKIPTLYDEVHEFSEGMACVKTNGRFGFINSSGTICIAPTLQMGNFHYSFQEGLVGVRVNEKWGFMDKYGRFVISPQFINARSFSEGFANVLQVGGVDGYIDKTGFVRIKSPSSTFAYNDDYSESLAPFSYAGHNYQVKMGFIDNKGNVAINPQFESAISFKDGLARVQTCGKYGFIDKTGAQVIKPQFIVTDSFYEGLAVFAIVNSGYKHGFINRKGEIVIKPIYNDAWRFRYGLARIRIDDKMGYIDKLGNLVYLE